MVLFLMLHYLQQLLPYLIVRDSLSLFSVYLRVLLSFFLVYLAFFLFVLSHFVILVLGPVTTILCMSADCNHLGRSL